MSAPPAGGGRNQRRPARRRRDPAASRAPVVGSALESAAGDQAVEGLAWAGLALFKQMGIDVEIVRSRANCLVVRSFSPSTVEAPQVRALVTEWLETLPRLANLVAGSVVESTGTADGGRGCIHTLLWNGRVPPPPPALSPPAALALAPPAAFELAPPPDGSTSAIPPPPRWSSSPLAGTLPAQFLSQPVPRAGAPPSAPTRALQVVVAAPTDVLPGTPAPPHTDGADERRNRTFEGHHPVADPASSDRTALRGTDRGTHDRARRPVTSAVGPARVRRRWAWLRRRWWMPVIGLLAGTLGGYLAGAHASTSYSSTAVLVVQSGASPTGPGSANDAEELAVTYAALIPEDQSLVHQVAGDLGASPSAVSRRLGVEAESGTSLLEVRFSASTPAVAIAGADDVARLLSSDTPPGHAIPAGSVAIVSPPRSAAVSGSLHKYGLPLGLLLGLLLGCGAALVAERTDRRVDDLESLGDGAGCPATALPGGISAVELAMALERDVDAPVTVVPLRPAQARTAAELVRALSAAWPSGHNHPVVRVSPAFVVAPESLGNGEGATVMVVGTGERLGVVHEVADRLRLVGRDPAWAVLDVGAGNRVLSGRGG
jgi:capsular polysaccharide biosynthesis protein